MRIQPVTVLQESDGSAAIVALERVLWQSLLSAGFVPIDQTGNTALITQDNGQTERKGGGHTQRVNECE